ncbi:Uncharacterised protein [uncultured Blautia sp.]|nr:Uncharacterised protein [uncultured Blautia sp.]
MSSFSQTFRISPAPSSAKVMTLPPISAWSHRGRSQAMCSLAKSSGRLSIAASRNMLQWVCPRQISSTMQ